MRPAMFLLMLAAAAAELTTDQIISLTKEHLIARIDAKCPGSQAPSVATDLRVVSDHRYEITFDDLATFHVTTAADAITQCVPDPCNKDPRKQLAITMADVDAINRQRLPWKAALRPEFHGRTADSFGTGSIQPPAHEKTILKPLKSRRALNTSLDMPVTYDARDTYPGQIRCKAFNVLDQGGCGCCYAFASAASFSARMCRASPNSLGNIVLSPEQFAGCTNGCGGGNSLTVLGLLVNQGNVELWCDPYSGNPQTCNNFCSTGSVYTAVPGSVKAIFGIQQMQAELIKNGPGSISIMAYSDFNAYSSGVYTPSAGAIQLSGHDMSLIGWGVDNGVPYWLLQNSWGAAWGEQGFVRILRGSDTCTIESRSGLMVATPVVPTACPNSKCANGSTTLADCTCQCADGYTGADCSACSRVCQHGGWLDPATCQCTCPVGYSGANCESGYSLKTLATCSGGNTITVSYTGEPSIQQGSLLGIYALSQTLSLNYLTSKAICGSYKNNSLCAPNGTIIIATPKTAGRYKVAIAACQPSNGFFPLSSSATIGYFTVLAANCSASNLSAAIAANDPANLLNATVASQIAAQAALQVSMTARLDAALPFRASLSGVFSMWVPGVLNPSAPVLWLGTTMQLCYSIPWYMDSNPKGLTLYAGPDNTGSYYTNVLGAAANTLSTDLQSCINISIGGIPVNGVYTISMDNQNINIGQFSFTTGKANILYSSATIGATVVTVNMAWSIDTAHASANDVVRIMAFNGTALDYFYTYCKCKTPPPAGTNATATGSFSFKTPRNPNGRIKALMFPGNGLLPGSLSNSLPWSNYGM